MYLRGLILSPFRFFTIVYGRPSSPHENFSGSSWISCFISSSVGSFIIHVLNDGIKKIRLPQEATFDGSHRSGHLATLTGWGASEPGGAASPELRQATMMIFHDQYCNSSRSIVNDQGIVESTSSLLPKLFTSSVFCAGLSLSGNQSIDNFLEYQFSSFRIPWRNKWSYLCRRFWKSFS